MVGKERDRIAFGAIFFKLLERGSVEVKGEMRRYLLFRNLVKVESIICREDVEQLLIHNGNPYK